MSSTVSVPQVVQAILDDRAGGGLLVQRRKEFADALEVPSAKLIPWINSFNLEVATAYDLLSRFLSDWVERNESRATTEGLSRVLKSMDLVATAETVSGLSPNAPSTQITTSPPIPHQTLPNKPLSFGVKPPVETFVGRTTELAQLQRIYSQRKKKIVVIWAMGGQGKTQLAKRFIQDLTTSSEVTPSVVTWFKAESSQQLSASISRLATKVGSSLSDPKTGKPLPIKKLVKRIIASVKKKYPTNPRWLVVLDNVDDDYSEFEEIVGKFIHSTEISPLLLITSRRTDIFPGEAHPLSLQTLTPEDAQELVRNALGAEVAEEDVVDLCTTLGHHALALQQALAHISAQQRTGFLGRSYSIQNFVEDFKNSSKVKTVIQHRLKTADYDHTIHRIVHTTLTFIQTHHHAMKEIVDELAFILGLVHPDGIKLETLLKLIEIYQAVLKSFTIESPGEAAELSLSSLSLVDGQADSAILLLAKFSLVNLDNQVISVHRVIQTVLRQEHECESNFLIFLSHIDKLLIDTASSEEILHILHIRSIWSHADGEAVKAIPNFPNKIFDRMEGLSMPLELMGFAEQNHHLLSKIIGPEYKETLEMGYNVALALRQIGEYEKSLNKFKQVLEGEERVLRKDHPSILSTLAEIGVVLYHLERYEESLEWYEKLLKALGEDTEFTMITRNNIALTLKALGRVDEALEMYHQVLEWRMEELGPSDQSTLSIRHNIAAIFYDQGRLEVAKTAFEEVLAIETETLGVEHTLTLNTKDWLAEAIWSLGDKENGLDMMKEVLASREKVLGHTHPRTQVTRSKISKWTKEE